MKELQIIKIEEASPGFTKVKYITKPSDNITIVHFECSEKYCEVSDGYIFREGVASSTVNFYTEHGDGQNDSYVFPETLFGDKNVVLFTALKHEYVVFLLNDVWNGEDVPFKEINLSHTKEE